MKGIEFNINGLKFYHSKNSDLLDVYLEIFTKSSIEISLDDKDIVDINNRMEIKIEECIIKKKYFDTNRKFLSRVRNVCYKGVDYKLNLSEPKHYYFYELISLYNNFNNYKNKTLSLTFLKDDDDTD